MHATSKMHLPAHNFRLWCSATSHQDAGIVVRQDASTAGCHALVFTPFPRCPTPFEPFTLLFHLVIVIFLLLPPMLLLLLLHLCGALRFLFSFFFVIQFLRVCVFDFELCSFCCFPGASLCFIMHGRASLHVLASGVSCCQCPKDHISPKVTYNGPRPLLFVT